MSSTFAVLISSFPASTTAGEVLEFVKPAQPLEVSFRNASNDPRGGQVATVAFRHRESAEILIAKKDLSLSRRHASRHQQSHIDRKEGCWNRL